MQNLFRAEKDLLVLKQFPLSLDLINKFKGRGFVFEIIPSNGDFSEYIEYVSKNKETLTPEFKYIENVLRNGQSWGEILVVRNDKNEIVASLGPNRIEEDDTNKKRAKPGYFSVLPQFRNNGIGTVLFGTALERMSAMGANYIKISVEKDNLAAIKVYRSLGMKLMDRDD